jgi:quinol monooxygenase YgiN
MSSGMIILAGTLRLARGTRADALSPIQTMVEATRAEPGCLTYAFAFDALDDHLLRIFEVFENEAALAAHRASPHMASWRADMLRLGMAERDMSEYVVSGQRKI